MDECRGLFYDQTFEEKLDSIEYLLGFNNGVYDLNNDKFRDGRPDDYITMSTTNDYIEYEEDHEYICEIFSIFKQIFPARRKHLSISLFFFHWDHLFTE
jgi:phage/plasmid-associated DNA primase